VEVFARERAAFGPAAVFEAADRLSTRAVPGPELDLTGICG
jgi:hypothetical protein